jgi:hypothetical protein
MKAGRFMFKSALFAAVAAGATLLTSSVNAAVFDLTAGGTATINGAIFVTNDSQSTGTGVIRSFVRISAANQNIVEGYNTDGRPLQFDENNSPQFTHSLNKGDLAPVTVGGVEYYKFLLDINQTGTNPLLSLNELEVYIADAPNLLGLVPGSGFGTHSTLIYDMDVPGNNTVELNYLLNEGSGSGDLFVFIKKSLFNGAGSKPWVYLYSKFGDPQPNNDGFEEWAALVGPNTPQPIPLPASVWAGLALLALMGVIKIRSRRQTA